MSMTALAGFAAEIGAPLVAGALRKRLGGAGGDIAADLAQDTIQRLAQRVGVSPDALPSTMAGDRIALEDAVLDVERVMPEMIALYTAELEAKVAILAREDEGPWFRWAWRSGWMWLLGILWLWNLVLLHIANALWKTALPMADLTVLLSLTGLFLSLYMGGHTFKAIFGKGARDA